MVKKGCLCAAALLFAWCFSVQAVSLWLNNGTELQNVFIQNYYSGTVTLSAYLPDGSFTVRQIRMRNLTPLSRMRVVQYLLDHPGVIRSPSLYPWDGSSELSRTMKKTIPVTFHALEEWGVGTIGWAKVLTSGDQNEPLGRIYVQGLFLPQGNVWDGRIRPLHYGIYIHGIYHPVYRAEHFIW